MTTPAALPGLLADLRARLHAAGVPAEPLARLIPARRVLLIQRPETLQEIGRAWPLGLLLLPEVPDAAGPLLHAEGTLTRARPPERVGYVAESARERDALRWTASRAGFATGQSVHVDPLPLDLEALAQGAAAEAGPILLAQDGSLRIRWARAASPQDLGAYLRERTDLLLERAGR